MKTDIHFWSYIAELFLEWEMFQTNLVEKVRPQILCSIIFFSPENRAVYEIKWKNIVQPGRSQMAIWRKRFACWIPKATNTHSEYVILIAFLIQQGLHERASLLRDCLSCWTFSLLVHTVGLTTICCKGLNMGAVFIQLYLWDRKYIAIAPNILCVFITFLCRDRSIGIATRYGLDGPGIESRWGRGFPHPSRPALGPTQSPIASFPGVKRPGRGTDHPPPSSAEVKERVELYRCSPSRPSWLVLG